MMKKEFEKRIGLVITSGEYGEIEAAYMGLPGSVDKDKFVKIWLREGGIQDLFDKRLLKVKSLKEALEKKEAEVMYWVHAVNDLGKKRDELKTQVEELEKKLTAIGNLAAGNAA
jgi:phage shock protein A